jgi:predicted nucleotidyltransferase component of viral defense system
MLQTRTVEPATLGLLTQLMSQPYLEQFALVGGTALALQLGHRFSVDLDLFTSEPFDKDDLIEDLKIDFNISIESESRNIVITNINNVKVDFVKVPYPIIFPIQFIENIRLLDIRDIAPMKLSAVTQRGSKKDFYDIYFLIKKMSLAVILNLYLNKFQNQTVFHVLKSLTYFYDAEKYADPIVFDKKLTWEKVKVFLVKEVQEII